MPNLSHTHTRCLWRLVLPPFFLAALKYVKKIYIDRSVEKQEQKERGGKKEDEPTTLMEERRRRGGKEVEKDMRKSGTAVGDFWIAPVTMTFRFRNPVVICTTVILSDVHELIKDSRMSANLFVGLPWEQTHILTRTCAFLLSHPSSLYLSQTHTSTNACTNKDMYVPPDTMLVIFSIERAGFSSGSLTGWIHLV